MAFARPGRLPRSIVRRPWAPAFAVVLAVAACTYRGAIDVPPTQKLTWFSYLNGDDIRAACGPGAPTRFRLVYNGNYNEQIRSYEVTADGAGGALQVSRVQGPANVASIAVRNFSDLLAPWRWTKAETRLDPAAADRLARALEASGFFQPPPPGLVLHSIGFWWIAVGCTDGKIRFNAWNHPSDRFAALSFPEVLFAQDATEVAVNPPRRIPPSERSIAATKRVADSDAGPTFRLEVGPDGLLGFRPLL